MMREGVRRSRTLNTAPDAPSPNRARISRFESSPVQGVRIEVVDAFVLSEVREEETGLEDVKFIGTDPDDDENEDDAKAGLRLKLSWANSLVGGELLEERACCDCCWMAAAFPSAIARRTSSMDAGGARYELEPPPGRIVFKSGLNVGIESEVV